MRTLLILLLLIGSPGSMNASEIVRRDGLYNTGWRFFRNDMKAGTPVTAWKWLRDDSGKKADDLAHGSITRIKARGIRI